VATNLEYSLDSLNLGKWGNVGDFCASLKKDCNTPFTRSSNHQTNIQQNVFKIHVLDLCSNCLMFARHLIDVCSMFAWRLLDRVNGVTNKNNVDTRCGFTHSSLSDGSWKIATCHVMCNDINLCQELVFENQCRQSLQVLEFYFMSAVRLWEPCARDYLSQWLVLFLWLLSNLWPTVFYGQRNFEPSREVCLFRRILQKFEKWTAFGMIIGLMT